MEIEISKEEKKDKGYDEWEQRRFAETLMEAEEIKKDQKKMAAAQKYINKQKKAISSIEELKAVRKEKMENDDS